MRASVSFRNFSGAWPTPFVFVGAAIEVDMKNQTGIRYLVHIKNLSNHAPVAFAKTLIALANDEQLSQEARRYAAMAFCHLVHSGAVAIVDVNGGAR